jgi:mRNA-degrading endonuclease RelE of RelBE toxin-antitoxin system
MKLEFIPHFIRAYNKAPPEIQRAFDKQSILLLENLRHPSLRAKKYDEGKDRWQARVTKGWRFYFMIKDDTYIIEDIISHPK